MWGLCGLCGWGGPRLISPCPQGCRPQAALAAGVLQEVAEGSAGAGEVPAALLEWLGTAEDPTVLAPDGKSPWLGGSHCIGGVMGPRRFGVPQIMRRRE